MVNREQCIFCDIGARKAPASMIYEDERVCAFLTIGPVNPGHLLAIPREHVPYLADLDEETGAHQRTLYFSLDEHG